VVGALFFAWWNLHNPVRNFAQGVPGEDNRPPRSDSASEAVVIGELFFEPGGVLTELTETWPRFRGSDFDNISKSDISLINSFGGKVPEPVWSVELGEGHAGAAIWKGAVYVLDYDELRRSDMLRCFNLTDGKEIWQRGYRLTIRRNHGMSRTVPAVTEKYIVTIGPRAHVMCVDRATGAFRWGLDVEKEYKTEIPFWYTGQCPIIYNDQAIVATGGAALLVAIDCETGEKTWETPNPGNWKMSHSSIVPMNFGGRKMLVYSAVGGICGVSAEGPDAGQVLWSSAAWNKSVVAPSPVCLPDGRIFLTAGYGAGSMMIRLKPAGSRFEVEVLDQYPPSQGLACEQQSPIYFQGHLIGIQPKDAAALRNQIACFKPDDLRNPVWASGSEARFGLGPYMIADNKLFILNDDGVLTITTPSVKSYIQIDQVRLFEGQDAWAPIAVADGYMVLRDSKRMVCLKMTNDGRPTTAEGGGNE
jgi:outer membrane protein assembly factor BamB